MADYTGALVEVSARYGDQYNLAQGQLNVNNGSNTWTLALPSDWDSALILEGIFEGYNGNDAFTWNTGAPPAVMAYIVSPAGVGVQPVDVAPLYQVDDTLNVFRFASHFKPDQPVLFRNTERLLMRIPTIGEDAGDTADYYVSFLMRRLYST